MNSVECSLKIADQQKETQDDVKNLFSTICLLNMFEYLIVSSILEVVLDYFWSNRTVGLVAISFLHLGYSRAVYMKTIENFKDMVIISVTHENVKTKLQMVQCYKTLTSKYVRMPSSFFLPPLSAPEPVPSTAISLQPFPQIIFMLERA